MAGYLKRQLKFTNCVHSSFGLQRTVFLNLIIIGRRVYLIRSLCVGQCYHNSDRIVCPILLTNILYTVFLVQYTVYVDKFLNDGHVNSFAVVKMCLTYNSFDAQQ